MTQDSRHVLSQQLRLTVNDVCHGGAVPLTRHGMMDLVEYLCGHFELLLDNLPAMSAQALLWSAGSGHLHVVRWLCTRHPPSAEAVDRALEFSECHGHDDVARWLRQHSASIQSKGNECG